MITFVAGMITGAVLVWIYHDAYRRARNRRT